MVLHLQVALGGLLVEVVALLHNGHNVGYAVLTVTLKAQGLGFQAGVEALVGLEPAAHLVAVVGGQGGCA